MARFTSAYSTFRLGLDEVNSLCKIAGLKEKQDPIGSRHEINAICRGAVVLLSAHLEAYIKDLGESALDALHMKGVQRTRLDSAIFYHVSKDLLDEVSDAREPAKVAERVFNFLSSDSSYWSRNGPFPQPIPAERFNTGFSNPSFNKIRAYFNRFGYTDYRRDIARRLKADFVAVKNMVDHLVDTRNKIAHGDSYVTKTPREIVDIVIMVCKYGMATDAAFAAWCKKNLCSIK